MNAADTEVSQGGQNFTLGGHMIRCCSESPLYAQSDARLGAAAPPRALRCNPPPACRGDVKVTQLSHKTPRNSLLPLCHSIQTQFRKSQSDIELMCTLGNSTLSFKIIGNYFLVLFWEKEWKEYRYMAKFHCFGCPYSRNTSTGTVCGHHSRGSRVTYY